MTPSSSATRLKGRGGSEFVTFYSEGIGITKLAGYSRCLSVIESVIPKSKKTALAINLAPMVLGIKVVTFRPSTVSHLSLRLSSDRRTIGVLGMSIFAENLLFSISQVPLLPLLKESATGT